MLDSPKLANLLKFTEELRQVDEQFPIQRVTIFLLIASKPEIDQSTLAKTLGTTQVTAGRNLIVLRDLGWIKATPRSDDARILNYEVTPKGQVILKKLGKFITVDVE